MSAAQRMLALLADGVPRTNPEIANALGCTQLEAREILGHLKYRGKVHSEPVRYSIAVNGIDRTVSRRKRIRTKRADPAEMKAQHIVREAIRSQPALQAAWRPTA